jgi:hypothetical protein
MNWAKRKMYELRNNQFRPEQIELYKQLRATRSNSDLLMEYEVTYKYDDEERVAIGDIVDLTKKEIFRLNGPIHMSSEKRILRDGIQKEGLEAEGWKVTDVDTDV